MIYLTGLAAFCLAWLLPGHFFPWTAFQQETVACVGACLVSLAAVITSKEWPIRLPAVVMALAALACVPMAQWFVGFLPYLSDGLVPSAYLLALAMMIVTGMALSNADDRFAGSLAATCLVGAFASLWIGLIQWLRLGAYGYVEAVTAGDRVYANLLQPNHLASLIGLGAVAVIWAYESRRIGGLVATLALSFVGWGLAMTQSRVGWMSVLLFALLWVAYRRRIGLRAPLAAVAGGLIAFSAMVLVWPPLNRAMYSDSGALDVAGRIQPGYRWIHWETCFDALLQSPWAGYGWLQIGRAQQAAALNHPATFEQLGSCHNQFLDLMLWNGMPIGALAVGLMLWWGISRMRHCGTLKSWAMIAGLGVLFAHSMVEFPLQYSYFLLPAGLMIGVVEAEHHTDRRIRLRLARLPYVLVCAALAILTATVVQEYLNVEEQVKRVRLREMGVVEAPGFKAEVPEALLLDAPREYVRMWVRNDYKPLSRSDLAWLRTISQRYPTPPALTRYAVASALSGYPQESVRALSILCHIQLPRHCDQARSKWIELGKERHALEAIPFPETPSN